MLIEPKKSPFSKELFSTTTLRAYKENIIQVLIKIFLDLIRNFGLRIESVNSSDIAVKKNLHPRVNTSKNLHI
jgi:hypothetical protein